MSVVKKFRSRCESRVIGVLQDRFANGRCSDAFGNSYVPLSNVDDLVPQIRSQAVDLVMVSARDRTGALVAPRIARIARRDRPPVVAYIDTMPDSLGQLRNLLNAGISDLIIRDVDDSPHSLRGLLRISALNRVVADSQAVVDAHMREPHRSLWRYCLAHATSSVSAPDIATVFDVTARTLTNWTTRRQIRGIRGLLGRCRVVLASSLLRESRFSAERIALELGFGSSSHLCNAIKRYTHLGWRDAITMEDPAYWCMTLLVQVRER